MATNHLENSLGITINNRVTPWLFGKEDARIDHRRAESFFNDVIANTYDWDLSVGTVISIYGAGGEGKSLFMNSLSRLCEQLLPDTRYRMVRLDFFNESSSTLSNLHSIYEGFAAAGIFCSRFAMAYQSYQHPSDRNRAAQEYLRECEFYINDHSIMDGLSHPFGTLFGITSIACDVLSVAVPIPALLDTYEWYKEHREQAELARARREARELWDDVANYDKMTLLKRMPRLLEQDIEEALAALASRDVPCRPLVIVDSFEHLNEMGTANELSLTGDLVQRLTHISETLWVVAGRNSLEGVGWDNVVHYPIELIDLNYEETAALLRDFGLDDEGLSHDIYQFSGGLPLFIALCAEAIKDLSIKKERLSFRELMKHTTREELLGHFVDNLDDDMELAVYAMSYLHEWNEDLLATLLCGNNLIDADEAELIAEDAASLSFVTRRGVSFQMHERIAAMLRSLPPKTRPMKASFEKLFRNMHGMLENPAYVKQMHIEEVHHLRLMLSRGIWELSRHRDAIPKAINDDQLYKLRNEYIGELEWAGLREKALAVIEETLPLYADDLERKLMLRLRQSAQLTQLWIQTNQIDYHLKALENERAVLAQIEADGVEHHSKLAFRTRNSIGLSLQRIAQTFEEIEESLSFLRPNYEILLAQPREELSGTDTFSLNNYGTACLRAAALSADTTSNKQFLTEALGAFSIAVEARERIFGENDIRTLRCISNKAIALERLGRFADADMCYKLADMRFIGGGYVKGNSDWLYNRYHQAILLELEAEQLAKECKRSEALGKLQEAHELHCKVLEDKERYQAGAQAIEKTIEHVKSCEERLESWK